MGLWWSSGRWPPCSRDGDGCFAGGPYAVSPATFGQSRESHRGSKRSVRTSTASTGGGGHQQLMTPSEPTEPQEKLLEPRRQLKALCLGTLAALLCLWALRAPAACVRFPAKDEAAPRSCSTVPADLANGAHLLDFCSLPCGRSYESLLGWALTLGLALQALTVLPSVCDCGGQFLRVTWRMNFTGDVAEFRELADSPDGSWLWRRVQAWTGETRGSLFEWLNGVLQKQSRTLPVPASAASSASLLLLLVAIVELGVTVASALPLLGASFECEGADGGHVRVEAPPHPRWPEVATLVVALVLLLLDVALQSKAEWGYFCQQPVGDVRASFSPAKGQLIRDGRVICPATQHPLLSHLVGMELLEVRRDGQRLPVDDSEAWGEDDELVELQFADYREPPSERQLRRQPLLVVAGLGVVLLYNASSECWSCVDGVRLRAEASWLDVEAQVLLLGACGRRSGSGVPCTLACWSLAVMLVAQLIVVCSGDKADPRRHEHMTVTLLDCREYQENLLGSVYADQEVRSHVWLRPVDGSWEVADFATCDDDEEARSLWRRSQNLVSGVRIVRAPAGEGWACVHGRGLPRDEGTPCVQVEFGLPGPSREEPALLRQLVPAEFLPGSFFCSVNVGGARAWTLLSLAFAVLALALVVVDLAFHYSYVFTGSLLLDCNEVLSGRCLEIGDDELLSMHTSMGVYLAMLGGVCAAGAIACLRRL